MGYLCAQTARPCTWGDTAGDASYPKVFIVDGDQAARHQLLRAFGECQFQVESFAGCHEFLSASPVRQPGCVVLDWDLHESDGLDVLKLITDSACTLPVIVVTAVATGSEVVQAFHRGVFDFFQKPVDSRALVACVERAIAADATCRCLEGQLAEIERRESLLNETESQLLGMLVAGKSDEDIAHSLQIVLPGLADLRRSLFEKMDVDTLAELAGIEAIRRVLIEFTQTTGRRLRFDQPQPDVHGLIACPLWLKHTPNVGRSTSTSKQSSGEGDDDDDGGGAVTG